MTTLQQQIVNLYKQDGHLDAAMVATTLGKSVAEIEAELAILQANGTLISYTTVVDNADTDNGEVEAWIEVKVTPQRNQGYDSLARQIAVYPEVKDLYLMSGAYDFAVTVRGRNLREVSNFVHEKLAVMDNVISTTTHFFLKCYKVAGVNLLGEGENRLPLHE